MIIGASPGAGDWIDTAEAKMWSVEVRARTLASGDLRTKRAGDAESTVFSVDQILPTTGAFPCLSVPFQGFGGPNSYSSKKANFPLYLLCLRGYTRRRRRGRVVEGAPLLRE